MCQCPYPVSSAVRKTPSEAARSALESPQDLSDQIWDTEKGAFRYIALTRRSNRPAAQKGKWKDQAVSEPR